MTDSNTTNRQISIVIFISYLIWKSLWNVKKRKEESSGAREGKILLMLILLMCLQNFEAKDISEKGIKAASESNHVGLLKLKGFLDLSLYTLNSPQNACVTTCQEGEIYCSVH